MGRKKINNEIELFYNNYKGFPIDKNNICINCPNRLFHSGENVKFGLGNVSSGILFLLPTFNNISEIINILGKEYNEIIGLSLLENVYITARVKCITNREYNTYNSAINHCSAFLRYETTKFIFKNIIYFYINTIDYIDNFNYHQIQLILNPNSRRKYYNFRTLLANAINLFYYDSFKVL